MHYKALKELFGDENIFTIDLRPVEAKRTGCYVSYGKYRNAFDRLHRWYQGHMMFISDKIIDDICCEVKKRKIEKVWIEDSVFGALVKEIKEKMPYVRIFTFYHDIKADLYRRWIQNNRNFVSYIEYSNGIKQERINQKYTDYNIVFNERDAAVFEKYYKKRPEAIIPLPAPVPKIPDAIQCAVTPVSEKKQLLFVGKKYYPNLVGFKWFVDDVLVSLTDDIDVTVVGRGLEELRQEYSDPRIHIVGGVDSLNPYYENADIVIAPLFDGGGMKSKTVEAFSFGKVFVGTEESLFGFWEEITDDIRGKKCFQCDSAEEWIRTLNKLTTCDINKFNRDVFELFKEKFAYNVIRDKLKVLMEG